MTNLLEHRGPDNEGLYLDSINGVALGHRRLSILDLSDSGNQPMITQCEKFILVYNGEIYNHLEIREKLSFGGWRSSSDTETLLYACKEWGFEQTLKELNGMFALGLFNKNEKRLYLARDRVGIKPIYFGKRQDTFVFASELKPILTSDLWDAEVDRRVLLKYLQLGFIPAPDCIIKDVQKLMPGSYLVFDIERFDVCSRGDYWSLNEIVQNEAGINRQSADYDSNLEILGHLLTDSVKKRMLSDVPLGTFLSGGYDSSLITAIAKEHATDTLNTYSIGFRDKEYDESVYAEQVAKFLGTNHVSQTLDKEDCLDIVPELSSIYDEPFADSSQIPTHLVSRLASGQVKVILSGDGADELFSGYNRHFLGDLIWRYSKRIPHFMRTTLGRIGSNISYDLQKRLIHLTYPKSREIPHLNTKIQKFYQAIQADSIEELYHELTLTSSSYRDVLSDGFEKPRNLEKDSLNFQRARSYFAYQDMMQVLPDDMLTKVDRASMACGLEVRVPFLDHRIVEHAWNIPFNQKIKTGEGKWILKQLAYQYIPRELLDRPKKGFEVPIAEWLREDLKDWAEELLFHSSSGATELFEQQAIEKIWKEHQQKSHSHKNLIWAILMYRSWEKKYIQYI